MSAPRHSEHILRRHDALSDPAWRWKWAVKRRRYRYGRPSGDELVDRAVDFPRDRDDASTLPPDEVGSSRDIVIARGFNIYVGGPSRRVLLGAQRSTESRLVAVSIRRDLEPAVGTSFDGYLSMWAIVLIPRRESILALAGDLVAFHDAVGFPVAPTHDIFQPAVTTE